MSHTFYVLEKKDRAVRDWREFPVENQNTRERTHLKAAEEGKRLAKLLGWKSYMITRRDHEGVKR